MRCSPHPGLEGLPVLVVEDDPASAQYVSVLLTNAGCDVRVALTAEDALTVLERFSPGAVVLDLVLPRMSGLLLARHLKSEPSTRDVPIIAVSVMDAPDAKRLALDTGCSAFVHKPIDPMTFPAILARHAAPAATLADRKF